MQDDNEDELAKSVELSDEGGWGAENSEEPVEVEMRQDDEVELSEDEWDMNTKKEETKQ